MRDVQPQYTISFEMSRLTAQGRRAPPLNSAEAENRTSNKALSCFKRSWTRLGRPAAHQRVVMNPDGVRRFADRAVLIRNSDKFFSEAGQ